MAKIIHPTATIHPSAIIAEGAEIGAYVNIGEEVFIGEGTVIQHHTHIEKWTRIGKNNKIFPFVVIGTPPQDLFYQEEKTFVEIGDENIIREFSTIHRASGKEKVTRVGSHNYLMAYSHIAHNCVVGNYVVMANCASLAGHVEIMDHAVIGGLVGIHQFCRIGKLAIIGACSKVSMDVCPYLKADGHPLKIYGLNSIGLKRKGFSKETIKALKKAYRIIFRSSQALKESLQLLEKEEGDIKEIQELIGFIRTSKRGFHR